MSNSIESGFRRSLAAYEAMANALFADVQRQDNDAMWRFKWVHPRYAERPITEVIADAISLEDSRLVIARDQHFDSWNELQSFIEDVAQDGETAFFESAVEDVIHGRAEELKNKLASDADLVRRRSTRSHHATLLHYVAANGVENERQIIPPNALKIAALLLTHGAKADALGDMYDSQCTTMGMLVSSEPPRKAGVQAGLVHLLLDHGASIEGNGDKWQSPLMTALIFGSIDAANALVSRGATVNSLTVAAGLGDVERMRPFLANASDKERHAALALSAMLGRTEAVTLLLCSGADPNLYNPPGMHDHATPLHQAVWSGSLPTVRVLVESGAKLDACDTLYSSTPLGWAEHCQRDEIADYLRTQMNKTG